MVKTLNKTGQAVHLKEISILRIYNNLKLTCESTSKMERELNLMNQVEDNNNSYLDLIT